MKLAHVSNSARSTGAAGVSKILIFAGAQNDGVPLAVNVGASGSPAARIALQYAATVQVETRRAVEARASMPVEACIQPLKSLAGVHSMS